MHYRILNSADYGAPQSRKRLFYVEVRPGHALRWQEPVPSKGVSIAPASPRARQGAPPTPLAETNPQFRASGFTRAAISDGIARPAAHTRAPKLMVVSHQAWSPSSEGEDINHDHFISFPVGAKITVVERGAPDDWWEGRYDGKRGWFPSSYCNVVDEAAPEGSDAAAAAPAVNLSA